jgi:hypothetical protein
MASKNDRNGSDKLGPVQSGPEQYAPPSRRASEKPDDADQPTTDAFEDEIRGLVRRDISFQHRQPNGAGPAVDPLTEDMKSLIRRTAGASLEEIDRVIHELQSVREMVRTEGERVSREIAGYANLSQAALKAMKIITDSLNLWKSEPDK